MRVGVSLLPEHDWADDRHRWVRAEEYGFDHAWTYDHLAWRSLADSPWFATIPTLTAAALATTTLRLGTLVTTPNYRNPVPLAKELMTLDVISGGRLNIGLGAGASGYDATMLGQPELSPRQAADRFREFVTLLDLLLRQRQTNWQGDLYTAAGARTVPGCVQQPHPPFLIAANGPKTMRVAIERGAGWITDVTAQGGSDPDEWWAGAQRAVDTFKKATDAAQIRSPLSTRLLNMETHAAAFRSIDQFRDAFGRAADLGFTDVVIAWPRDSQPYAGDEKLLENLASQLDSIRDD